MIVSGIMGMMDISVVHVFIASLSHEKEEKLKR